MLRLRGGLRGGLRVSFAVNINLFASPVNSYGGRPGGVFGGVFSGGWVCAGCARGRGGCLYNLHLESYIYCEYIESDT
jgi:hypothetical protein